MSWDLLSLYTRLRHPPPFFYNEMMTGPTLTELVSPAVESQQSFPPHASELRSPSHDKIHANHHTTTEPSSNPQQRHSFHTKDISSPSAFDIPSFNFDSDIDTTLDFSTELLNSSANENSTTDCTDGALAGTGPRADKRGNRKSMLSRPQSWIVPTSKSLPDFEVVSSEGAKGDGRDATQDDGSGLLNAGTNTMPKNSSSALGSLTRRPWKSISRSPSPGGRSAESKDSSTGRPSRERSASNSSAMKPRKPSRKRAASPVENQNRRSTDSLGKLGNYLTRIKEKPQSMLVKLKTDLDSPSSSIISLAPPSAETRQSHASETSNSTFPEDNVLVKQPPLPRDPLWSAFKGLDADYQTFQTKSTTSKMNIIRNVLMPFLRKYGTHPSNKTVQLEDIERRTVILNKWWNGLLEMLDAKSPHPLAGLDRPTLLDTITALMVRPEWRRCTPTSSPSVNRDSQERLQRRPENLSKGSSSSVHSSDSAYFTESASHNVRTMFITNLVAQMTNVVDKLNLRHAPLSLVNFAGRTCAYAFFFAPGIADKLVRLWSLGSEQIRRTADEFGLPRRSKGESNDIVALFPKSVENLGWTCVSALSRSLRRTSELVLPASKIDWENGSWVSRWKGRDTDLFFVFCKYYYILVAEFTPLDLPMVEKARAPGFVLVSAQLLAVLDSTLHRQASVEAANGPLHAEFSRGSDDLAMALPITQSVNAFKGMNENRLVVLLKDFLGGASVSHTEARHIFAETFMAIMKASAKRTSQFDHSACFTICDFLEESLVAYEGFVDIQQPGMTYVDWAFWVEVLQRILESNNSMSEIRVLSLIFSVWDTIASVPERKQSLCLDWLLTEEMFNKFFNHWCPMVRAYYMRLLCWRICRDAGSANETDTKLFLVVSARLKKTWSHYLWLKQTAEQQDQIPPSTAPSFPTPGKRFLILRTEVPAVQQGLVVGFDSSTTVTQHDASTGPATDFDSMETASLESDPTIQQKKRWSLFGKVFSFSGETNTTDLDTVRRDTAASRSKPLPPPKKPQGVVSSPGSDSDSMGSSPIYEATKFVFKFTLSWNPAGTMAPPNRPLVRPRLPSPAQSWVSVRTQNGSQSIPAAGRPAPTRAVSGSPHPGLVDAARNADPSEVPSPTHRTSMTFDRRDSWTPVDRTGDAVPLRTPKAPTQEPIITPVEPKGTAATTVKYSGRALAEWSLVVAECNSFVDRRRDEGVLGLQDVEVPTLGVEGFRKLC